MEVSLSILKKRMVRGISAVACLFGLSLSFAAGAESLSDKVDSLSGSLDGIEDKVQSTLLSGGSSPVSFSGEARLKMQYHNVGYDAPGYMSVDRTYLQSGWEGNENMFRLGMVVRPGRNTVLWSKIGLQHTMVGNRSYEDRISADGFTPYQYRNDKVQNSVTIHEDMCAGIAVRTVPASFWVKLGNTLWTEASPLTVWKAQPRTFAWEYLPFEVEQPIARYYEYNIAKGEKAGRAAWNKKPFNGINVESINIPWDMYVNFVYGTYERYDNFEREYIDFAGELGYGDGADNPFPEKGHGIGDSYRHVTHGRIAKSKLLGDMTLGLNYVGMDYNNDIIYVNKGSRGGGMNTGPSTDNIFSLINEFRGNDSVFYKEPHVISLDLRGSIGEKFSIHSDVALNWTDTTWLVDNLDTLREDGGGNRYANIYAERMLHPEWYDVGGTSRSDFRIAFYSKLNYHGFLPAELDLAYIPPGFYSPFSFATPADAFYAFGSNMVGAGKFMARGEGSPYTQNMMGANLTLTPKLPGYGHFRVKYGQHFNVNDQGQDLLFFPYRLNGSDMFSFFHSSYNRWGNGLIDNSVKSGRTYRGRLGDESFWHSSGYNNNLEVRPVAGPGAGGLRSDFLSMYEGFVAYNDSMEAYLNFRSKQSYTTYQVAPFAANQDFTNLSTITNRSLFFREYINDESGNAVDSVDYNTNTSWVPTSKKYTFNLELDAAYDIGPYIGYKKDLFVGGYVGINGVTRGSMSLLALNEKGGNTLLWSLYARLEPAIALHKNFYLLGLFGFENWRSDKSWMLVNKNPAGQVIPPTSGGSVVYNPTTTNFSATRMSPDNFVRVPIDYRDYAYGLGFDWDMLERVGLHGRVKWISHEDKGLNDMYEKWHREGFEVKDADGTVTGVRETSLFNYTSADQNDWRTPVFSLEIKMWF
jgi:hypothetical protein